jgi:hypothetical protein
VRGAYLFTQARSICTTWLSSSPFKISSSISLFLFSPISYEHVTVLFQFSPRKKNTACGFHSWKRLFFKENLWRRKSRFGLWLNLAIHLLTPVSVKIYVFYCGHMSQSQWIQCSAQRLNSKIKLRSNHFIIHNVEEIN